MRHLVSEGKVLLAVCFISLGLFLLTQASLFLTPVIISEKGLGLIILALVLLAFGSTLVVKAIKKA